MTTTEYIHSITIDEASITKRSQAIDHERAVAINDLIEWNHFTVIDHKGDKVAGPYTITLGAADNRILLNVNAAGSEPLSIGISIQPFRSIVRDYFMICESYFDAVKTGNLPRIEAIDMSRRGLHNEGADLLATLLEDKVTMDSETARRFFTLLCALHLK